MDPWLAMYLEVILTAKSLSNESLRSFAIDCTLRAYATTGEKLAERIDKGKLEVVKAIMDDLSEVSWDIQRKPVFEDYMDSIEELAPVDNSDESWVPSWNELLTAMEACLRCWIKIEDIAEYAMEAAGSSYEAIISEEYGELDGGTHDVVAEQEKTVPGAMDEIRWQKKLLEKLAKATGVDWKGPSQLESSKDEGSRKQWVDSTIKGIEKSAGFIKEWEEFLGYRRGGLRKLVDGLHSWGQSLEGLEMPTEQLEKVCSLFTDAIERMPRALDEIRALADFDIEGFADRLYQ